MKQTLRYDDFSMFRVKVVISVMSKKTLEIESKSFIQPHQLKFLELLNLMMKGNKMEVYQEGRGFKYHPGILTGGKVNFSVDQTRGISYYLLPILLIAGFCKQSLSLSLEGVTNHPIDPSIDMLRLITLPLLMKFGVPQGVMCDCKQRGYYPIGKGKVQVDIPMVKEYYPIYMIEAGKVEKIKGIVYGNRVSNHLLQRMIDGCKASILPYTPNIYIVNDYSNLKHTSPGYGLQLVAETNTGCYVGVGVVGEANAVIEEEIEKGMDQFLSEILMGGCIDQQHQHWVLLLMAYTPTDASQVRMGRLTKESIITLRLLNYALQMHYQLEAQPDQRSIVVSCIGLGMRNIVKKNL